MNVYSVTVKSEAIVAVLADDEESAMHAAMSISLADAWNREVAHVEIAEASDEMYLEDAQENIIVHADIICDDRGRELSESKSIGIINGWEAS